MLKIRRPLGRLIFNMGIAIPGKTVFLIETAPRRLMSYFTRLERAAFTYELYCMFYLPIFDKRMIHTFGFMVIFFWQNQLLNLRPFIASIPRNISRKSIFSTIYEYHVAIVHLISSGLPVIYALELLVMCWDSQTGPVEFICAIMPVCDIMFIYNCDLAASNRISFGCLYITG